MEELLYAISWDLEFFLPEVSLTLLQKVPFLSNNDIIDVCDVIVVIVINTHSLLICNFIKLEAPVDRMKQKLLFLWQSTTLIE